MGYTYAFLDPETAPVRRVKRGDSVAFEIERHQHIANVQGHAAEEYRAQGCPPIAPYVAPKPAEPAPVAPKAKPVDDADRRRRRDAIGFKFGGRG